MLSPYDDHPIHQTSAPVVQLATSDANATERYDFVGAVPATGVLFGATLGLYPHRGVIDASCSITVDGRQHSVHASGRLAPGSRTLVVGPFTVELVDPLRLVRLRVAGPAADELGLTADLTFAASTAALELPRHIERRSGSIVRDTTSFVQLGAWAGTVVVDGATVLDADASTVIGSRRRSWGVEPLGGRPTAPAHDLPQRFWAATTVWLPRGGLVTAVAEQADGRRTYQVAERLDTTPDGPPNGPADAIADPTVDLATAATDAPTGSLRDVDHHVTWRPGTRWADAVGLRLTPWSGPPVAVRLEPVAALAQAGLGPVNTTWPHGGWKDELAVGRDTWLVADLDPRDVHHLALVQLCRATSDEGAGWAVVEHLAVGPHAPSGLTGFTDGARPGTAA